jgi:hypothetical protein
MQTMQQQLQLTRQELKLTQQQLSQIQQTAQQADAKVATVETNSNLQVQRVQSDLSDVKAALNTTNQVAEKAEKRASDLEHPLIIAYKHIRITPGGFFDFTGYYRSHALNAGPSTLFNSLPLGAATNAHLSEFGQSARTSRLTLRTDAEAGKARLAGFFEMDFFAAGTNSNPNQTTSFPIRMRQAWGRVKTENGWSVTAGQMWNLMTLNRRATDADAPWVPNTLDTNYLVGYDWGRQAEVRVSKTLDKKITLALALTDPSYLNSGAPISNTQVAGLASIGAGNLASTVASCNAAGVCADANTYSTNLSPDILVKLAYDDPKLGHYEIKALQRFFRDRVVATTTTAGHNNTGLGAGIGAGAIIPVVSRKVDFIAQGLYGKGISRYEDSGQFDFVVRTNPTGATGGDNNLQDVKSFSLVAGFETHLTSRLEFDMFYGDEYYYRTTYNVFSTAPATLGNTLIVGYGSPTADNTGGCESTLFKGCAGSNRNLGLGTAVVWYDVYKGSYGTLRYGAQYEYAFRGTWSGNGTLPAGAPGLAPKGIENVGYLAMRYIIP